MLSVLIAIPILGAALVGFFPGNIGSDKLRKITLAIALSILVWTIEIATQFDITISGWQLQEYFPWIPQLGLSYNLAIDGLSFPLIALNSLLTLVAVYGYGDKIDRPRLYYSMMLLVNAGVAGAFMSENLLLFVLFYELELIPLYLLIAIWGSDKRGYAATKFLLYTALSGILILAAFLGITWLSNSSSFDYGVLAPETLPLTTKLVLLTILLIGFGIKVPLVPLHTWLPDAYVEASPPVTILLGGVLAKLGTYGLLRFGLGLFPETWQLIGPGLAIIGTISVLYGSLSAIAQQDIKRMVAYSSIGHMGYIIVAGAAGTPLSLVGAIAQMVAHGLILAILFHLVGIVEAKVGTRELSVLNGLMSPVRGLPLTSALLILGGMASAGIPGMVGFAAEFIVFQGSFRIFPIETLLCIIASGLTAVYFVILLNRTCFGKLDNQTAYYPKVVWSERVPALALALIIFVLGVRPTWLVKWSEATSYALTNVPAQVALQQQSRSLPPSPLPSGSRDEEVIKR
jgi:NAD(P)H-quinone oxidoreductase subunit 4